MGTPERIYNLVRTMPEDQASEVLDFIEFLRQKTKPQPLQTEKSLLDFAGILQDSPHFNEDPVAIQRMMRDEWS